MKICIPGYGLNRSSAIPEHISLYHYGAVRGVTGSCHLLAVNLGKKTLQIMVDCGSFQGREVSHRETSFPFKLSDINFLFLTHAHIDHIGRLPELIEQGFRGEILCTHPTC